MTDVIATKQPKAAEALDDSSLIDVAIGRIAVVT